MAVFPQLRISTENYVFHRLLCFTSLVLDFFASTGHAPHSKDLQIALLRQPLGNLERGSNSKPRLSSPKTHTRRAHHMTEGEDATFLRGFARGSHPRRARYAVEMAS
jgi:hypothetical protein